jgi:ABC-type multidrug transport system fused ATPase/permease subunit
LFRQPVSEIDSTSPGKIASRLTTNTNIIQMGISQQFAMAIQAISFTVGLYVVSFIRSALLTLVASATLPVILISYGGIYILRLNCVGRTSNLDLRSRCTLCFQEFQICRKIQRAGFVSSF